MIAAPEGGADVTGALLQIDKLKTRFCDGPVVECGPGAKDCRLDIGSTWARTVNPSDDASPVFDVGSGTPPNAIYLAIPPRVTESNAPPVGGKAGNTGIVYEPLLSMHHSQIGPSVNQLRAWNSPAGVNVTLGAVGADPNIHMRLSPKGTGRVLMTRPVTLPAYTRLGLPAPGGIANTIVAVTDDPQGRRLAVSDGIAWRWPDGTIVA
jgi:hypothetical protein